MKFSRFALALFTFFLACDLHAEAVKVTQPQGSTRGFLIVRSQAGEVLGYGELTQSVHGARLTTHIVFRFHDGSLDEETTTFTQNGVLRLLSDRHIQKGPSFPKPIDVSITADGTVTSRRVDEHGIEKEVVDHKDLPPDVYNGMIGLVLLSVKADTPPFKVGYFAPSGKGRLVQLAIAPESTGRFRDAGLSLSATIFRIHIELGGVAGVVAPMIGKQPEDIRVWVLGGEVPALVRELGALYDGGPVLDIQLSGATFPR